MDAVQLPKRLVFSTGPATDGDLILQTSIDRTKVYLGEQVTVTAELFARVEISGVDGFKTPKLDGFFVEVLESPKQISGTLVEIDGVPYRAFVLRKLALFPTRAGRLTIGAFEAMVQAGKLVNAGAQKRSARPVDVDVLPLPAPVPEVFPAANVGNWRLRADGPARVKQWSPFLFKFTLEGEGNLAEIVLPPLPPIEGARVLRASPRQEHCVTSGRACRVVEYELLPETAGVVEMPALPVQFFDPARRGYFQSCSEPSQIRVDPAPKPVAAAAPAAPAEVASEPVPARPGSAWPYLLVLALLVPFIAVVFFAARGDVAVQRFVVGLGLCAAAAIIVAVLLREPVSAIQASSPAKLLGPSNRKQTTNDVVLALDVSSSMNALDFEPDRLGAIKQALRGLVEQRPADRIGLVLYAGAAYAVAPLSFDREALLEQLVSAQTRFHEDGTATGDAIAVSLDVLCDASAADEVGGAELLSTCLASRRGGAIVLVTDGDTNVGRVFPIEMAGVAEKIGVTIHTVLLGKKGKVRFPAKADFFGNPSSQLVDLPSDPVLLTDLARLTGGRSFEAQEAKALDASLAAIADLLSASKPATGEDRVAPPAGVAITEHDAAHLLDALRRVGSQALTDYRERKAKGESPDKR
ncbi:MAG: VWA domain-containing protein [Myxococcales bacterium]